jgi:hypothetical protein
MLQSTKSAAKFTASTEFVVPQNDRVVTILTFTTDLSCGSPKGRARGGEGIQWFPCFPYLPRRFRDQGHSGNSGNAVGGDRYVLGHLGGGC